jgi:hypothetical protein
MEDMDYLKKLQAAMMGGSPEREEYVTTPLEEDMAQEATATAETQRETVQDVAGVARGIASSEQNPDQTKRDIEQTNEDARSPYMEPKAKEEYSKLIDQYKAKLAEPEKELGWKDHLPDVLASAHNLLNYAQGSQFKDIKSNHAQNLKKERSSKKKEELSGMQNLQKMYQNYMAMGKKDEMTPYQKKQVELAEKKLKSEGKKPKETEFGKAVHKKQAADFAESQKALQTNANNMSKVDEAMNAQLQYSKDETLGTGPIATLGGLTKYVSQDTESLDAKFKDIDLKNMVSTFAGMSKAVDSDAERRAWKSTQASVSNDDETNVQILLGSKSSLLKDRIVSQAKADYVDKYGNLDRFDHPILRGEQTTIVDPKGELQIVDKTQIPNLKKAGFRDLDKYASDLLKGKKESTKADPEMLIQKMQEKNPNASRERIIKGLRAKGLM